MIEGPDVSKFQTRWAIEAGHLFAVLNQEDPTCSDKIDRCIELGIPYAFYGWEYPGTGSQTMSRMVAHAELLALNGDQTPVFYWIDHEQNGAGPEDLAANLQWAANYGVLGRTGLYTYLSIVGEVDSVRQEYHVPLWIAYYPDPNNGDLHWTQRGNAESWGAVWWQYTSGHTSPTGERVDMNVVLDELWHRNTFLAGGGDDMPSNEEMNAYFFEPIKLGDVTIPSRFELAFKKSADEFLLPVLASWEQDTRRYILEAIAKLPEGAALDPKVLADAIADALGDEEAQKVVDLLAERLKA